MVEADKRFAGRGRCAAALLSALAAHAPRRSIQRRSQQPCRVLAGTLLVLTTGARSGSTNLPDQVGVAAGSCPGPAVAAAADALAATFDRHQFIFIGSTHGDLKIEEFLTCLISRPAFTRRVTDIVVEWASSGHQRLIDRYILALDAIPVDSLAAIWFGTDTPALWTTLPQVRRFVETLREVNRTLPAAKRVRLVGGSEGTDWT